MPQKQLSQQPHTSTHTHAHTTAQRQERKQEKEKEKEEEDKKLHSLDILLREFSRARQKFPALVFLGGLGKKEKTERMLRRRSPCCGSSSPMTTTSLGRTMCFLLVIVVVIVTATATATEVIPHGTSGSESAPASATTILEQLALLPDLSLLVEALSINISSIVTLNQLLSDPGSTVTIFAPTNTAIQNSQIYQSNDPFLVAAYLQYHITQGDVETSHLPRLSFLVSLLSNESFVLLGGASQVLEVSKSSSDVQVVFGVPGNAVTTATIVTPDIVCSNGVIQVIDTVCCSFVCSVWKVPLFRES